MKKYKIKAKAISPLHIGTGEVYEPINYVIDSGELFEFNEMEFFSNLQDDVKKRFLDIVDRADGDSLFKIHSLIKENKQIAKKVAKKSVPVSKALEEEYNKKLGKVVQIERGKDRVFKNFNFAKTIRHVNRPFYPYIPGSSLKGALLTAYGELIYNRNRRFFNRLFSGCLYNYRNPCIPSRDGNVFQNVLISDAKTINSKSIIGYALNKERFDPNDTKGPSQHVEVIYSDDKFQSTFEFELIIKKGISIEEIKEACDKHYLSIFNEMVDGYTYMDGERLEDFTNRYFSAAYWEFLKRVELKDNQFLLRVGKFSQARAVTINGIRRIRVKESGGGRSNRRIIWRTLDQETTSWLFGLENGDNNLLPFGWVICEIEEQNGQI